MIFEIQRETKRALMTIEIAPLAPVDIVVTRTRAQRYTARYAQHETQRPVHQLSADFLAREYTASSELEAVALLIAALKEQADIEAMRQAAAAAEAARVNGYRNMITYHAALWLDNDPMLHGASHRLAKFRELEPQDLEKLIVRKKRALEDIGAAALEYVDWKHLISRIEE